MRYFCCFAILFAFATTAVAQDQLTRTPDGDVSLKLEIERAIEKGVSWLTENQDKETGAWSDPKLPAFTALAISATLGIRISIRKATFPSTSTKPTNTFSAM